MASYNNYAPQQSNVLYSTNADTTDWAYGELGLAAFTFEIGSSTDGFYPSCSRYDALIQPNLPPLVYAIKASRLPYQTASGPDALSPVLTRPMAYVGEKQTIATILDDSHTGRDNISAAEYYIDLPPWAGGIGLPLHPLDGGFDEISENAWGSVNSASLSLGQHILYVRGQDSQGNWGPFTAVFFEIQSALFLPLISQPGD